MAALTRDYVRSKRLELWFRTSHPPRLYFALQSRAARNFTDGEWRFFLWKPIITKRAATDSIAATTGTSESRAVSPAPPPRSSPTSMSVIHTYFLSVSTSFPKKSPTLLAALSTKTPSGLARSPSDSESWPHHCQGLRCACLRGTTLCLGPRRSSLSCSVVSEARVLFVLISLGAWLPFDLCALVSRLPFSSHAFSPLF